MEKTQQKQRIPEMDVMKGILGILVIMGHIFYIEADASGVQPTGRAFYCLSTVVAAWIAPYYMAAFFFVTGYCSSFKSGIKAQLISDAKHLLLPVILIPCIMHEVSSLLLGNGFVWPFTAAPWYLWFLWALFWAKFIFWVMKHVVKSESIAWLLLTIMSVVGSAMMYYIPQYNYLGCQQALVFAIFIAIGHAMKDVELKPSVLYAAIIIYVLTVIASYYCLRWGAPSVCSFITFIPQKWPLYFLLATSGIMSVYQISKWLKGSKVLQYTGKHTLILYLVHLTFLRVVTTYLKPQIAEYYDNSYFQSSYFVLMTLGALLWSCLWAELLNSRYLKWILGKW